MVTQPDVATQQKTDLFVFGDSLSDTGNLFRKTGGLVPQSPPYFQGRFSNGLLAVEILAQSLGVSLDSRTNFAIGGARTDRSNVADNPLLRPGGLLDQVDSFKADAATLGAGAEDLYVVWAGGNDFLRLIDNPADPAAVVSAAVTNILTSVRSIAEAGAKNIVVVQTPNFGRVPLSLDADQLEPLANLSLAFNSALETALNAFERATPDKNIILSNLFPTIEAVAQNPAAFGFSNVTDPLLENPTGDPNQFFFWDQVHPTTRGHDVFEDVLRSSIVAGITDNITRIGSLNADRLVSFAGNDRLDGRAGNDYLEGNGGRDVLLGGFGNDVLLGGAGADQLTGGFGRDRLTGGAGRDRFIYTNANQGRDIITDFEVGRDVIDLGSIVSRRSYSRSDRFGAYVRLGSTAQGTIVRVDGNGDLRGGFKAVALLSEVNASELNAASFRFSA